MADTAPLPPCTIVAAPGRHLVARIVETTAAAVGAVLLTLAIVGPSASGDEAPVTTKRPAPAAAHVTSSPPAAQQVLAQQNAAHRP